MDLVCHADGRLRLAVNQWPDGIRNDSSPGKLVVGKWTFFAVTYDASRSSDNVSWYFSAPLDAPGATDVRLDRKTSYNHGPVGADLLGLAIGNFNQTMHSHGLDRQFRGEIRALRVFGSRVGGRGALTAEDINSRHRSLLSGATAPDARATTPGASATMIPGISPLINCVRSPGRAGLAPGDYGLKVAMRLPVRAGRNIQLGLAGRDHADRYLLCSLRGVVAPQSTGVVYHQSFEHADHRWSSDRSLEASLDTHTFHGGQASLRLTGSQSRGWNYASHALAIPVLPASRYRLSGWLHVKRLDRKSLPPYFKLGVTDGEGKWLENFVTGKYELDQSGTWQRLEAVIETPLETAGGHLALEQGAHDTTTEIELRIDDVQLELLEAP